MGAPQHHFEETLDRFHVETTAGGTLLVTGGPRRIEFPLQRRGISLHLSGFVTNVGRSVSPSSFADSRWIKLGPIATTIGAAGDEGFKSPLADDCVFVVHEPRLGQIPIRALRIVERGDIDRFETLLDERPPETAESFGRGWLSHMLPDKQGQESVDLMVGIPDPEYTGLFEDSVARRFDQVFVDCILGAYSTARDYETPRDIVLLAGQSLPVSVTDMSVGRTFGKPPNGV